MQTLNISATIFPEKKPLTINMKFPYFDSCGFTLTLMPYGEYVLDTIGHISDASVRRSSEYKYALRKISLDMLEAYENEDKQYVEIHKKNLLSVHLRKWHEDKLKTLSPQKYQRRSFDYPMPTETEVEDDLRMEAKALNYIRPTIDERTYVQQHTKNLMEKRRQAWIEAKELFDKIEMAREERENNLQLVNYKVASNENKAYIDGDDHIVEQRMKRLFAMFEVPYSFDLSYAYSQVKRLMEITIVIKDAVSVPDTKANILSSGKISIKNKLIREVANERTESMLSLIYAVAACAFNASPNIEYLDLSLYSMNRRTPLAYVGFGRTAFSQLDLAKIDLSSNVLCFPHVIDFKSKNGTLEILPWNTDVFRQNINKLLVEREKCEE